MLSFNNETVKRVNFNSSELKYLYFNGSLVWSRLIPLNLSNYGHSSVSVIKTKGTLSDPRSQHETYSLSAGNESGSSSSHDTFYGDSFLVNYSITPHDRTYYYPSLSITGKDLNSNTVSISSGSTNSVMFPTTNYNLKEINIHASSTSLERYSASDGSIRMNVTMNGTTSLDLKSSWENSSKKFGFQIIVNGNYYISQTNTLGSLYEACQRGATTTFSNYFYKLTSISGASGCYIVDSSPTSFGIATTINLFANVSGGITISTSNWPSDSTLNYFLILW